MARQVFANQHHANRQTADLLVRNAFYFSRSSPSIRSGQAVSNHLLRLPVAAVLIPAPGSYCWFTWTSSSTGQGGNLFTTINLHAHPRVGEVLNRTANSNDFTRLDFLDGQAAGGKVLAEVLEAIGRRMEDYDGDTATLHILVANIRIDGNEHIKFRFGRRQKPHTRRPAPSLEL